MSSNKKDEDRKNDSISETKNQTILKFIRILYLI